ncbi:ATPase [Candidatus Saganbacteria bacterium CG08_land_8_20_14_0_20_45_16]|uniref:ATPase n=1 Tax=Candidatus Saganbacteria bacterium CG08_land_8_20_14_0_20_45_16 TaxID=2014293 RepID=A0A2H0XUD8_UNCSA|nr:MAG: ATPase [Candidatus Saganbacteria bacterium CG08_land_8_20_14_0_20_45_16]
MYKQRYLEKTVLELNRSFKVIYLAGPRQVGKTTLLQHLAKRFKLNYVSLDDMELRRLAQEDPALFLQRYPTPLFIDEVQYAPQLFSYIKIKVDQESRNGQYWLTGSQQFSVMKNVKESLAGRVGIINLLGFSLAESRQKKQPAQPFLPGRPLGRIPAPDINTLFGQIIRGSFPVLTHKNAPALSFFYNSYLQTYIDRDLRDIFKVSKISDFHKFLSLCAARTGQVLNVSELARDAGISVHAAKEWLGILEASFQIYLVQPYYRNISKRLIKAPKLYFLDTGLAAYLTKWQTAETLAHSIMAGAFFETFVVTEILKSYWFQGKEAPLYYFRDKEKHEVDLLIEQEGKIYPVEIKLSARVHPADFNNINYLREKLKNTSTGAIITAGQKQLPFNKENEIIPASLLS